MKSCCKKIENTCQSTRTSGLSFEPNSYTVYSHKDFFWLPFKPTSAAKQTIIFLHPGKHFKAFLTFKPQFRDVVWPNSFPASWQVWHAPCTEPNNHSELLWQPSTLPAIRSSLVWAEENPDHIHTALTDCWLTVRNTSVAQGNCYKWKEKYWAFYHPIGSESNVIFSTATEELMWNSSNISYNCKYYSN